MYAQIGNIIFEGLNGFESFEHSDSTTYAQHDLITGKPVLVPTGNNLEEINISIVLRAEFIKPEEAILEIKKAKDSFEVLPLVKGSGRYMGDFIITEYTVTDRQALSDGTTIEAAVSLTLLEYAATDKLNQQQVAARKNAFATGDKKPLSVAAVQGNTVPQLASKDLTAVNEHADIVNNSISQYENNVSQQQYLSDKIKKSLGKMNDNLTAFNNKLGNIPLLENAGDIQSSVDAVKEQIGNFTFPITSISDLKLNNLNLQTVLNNLGKAAISLTNLVITRAA